MDPPSCRSETPPIQGTWAVRPEGRGRCFSALEQLQSRQRIPAPRFGALRQTFVEQKVRFSDRLAHALGRRKQDVNAPSPRQKATCESAGVVLSSVA